MQIDGQVVIVGGGIGGLTAALLFARLGTEVTVLERVRQPAEVGAGLLLQPNGLAVLAGLSLADALADRGYRTDGAEVLDAGGRPIIAVPIPDFGAGLDHVLAIRRCELFTALLDAVQAAPSIELRLGTQVTAMAEQTVRFTTPAGDTSSLTASIIVGADGAHSVVRESGRFEVRRSDTGTRYLRVIVAGEDLGLVGERWTRLGLVGGAPMGDGTTYFYAAAHDPKVADALDREDLAALVGRWATALPVAARALGRVQRFEDLLLNDVVRVDCGRWVDGSTVLIGDAAHAMSPTLGQGANSAMVDAAVLVDELAGAGSIAEGLERYAERRAPAVRKVQDAADRLARLSQLTSGVPVSIRNRLLRLVGRSSRLAERQARMAQQEDPTQLLARVSELAIAKSD